MGVLPNCHCVGVLQALPARKVPEDLALGVENCGQMKQKVADG